MPPFLCVIGTCFHWQKGNWPGTLTFIAFRGIRRLHTPFHSTEGILSWLGFIRSANPLRFYVPIYMWIFPEKRCRHFIRFSKGFMTEKRCGLDHLWDLSPDSLLTFYSPRMIRNLNLWLLLHWARRTVFKGTRLIIQEMQPFMVLSGSVLIRNDSLWEESIWGRRKKSNTVSFRRNKKLLFPVISKIESDCLTLTVDVWGGAGLGDCSEGEGRASLLLSHSRPLSRVLRTVFFLLVYTFRTFSPLSPSGPDHLVQESSVSALVTSQARQFFVAGAALCIVRDQAAP